MLQEPALHMLMVNMFVRESHYAVHIAHLNLQISSYNAVDVLPNV